MSGLVEFPGDRELKEEITVLKKEISSLVLRRDELKYTICENIKMKYMLEIGTLELKVYDLYIKYIRLKRKKELIQARINRNEKVELNCIEEQIEREFSEYKEKLNEKLKDISYAKARNDLPLISNEDSKRLKKLYLDIVKKIHPDLNPNITKEKIELFHHVLDAYKRCDLVSMETFYILIEEDRDFEGDSNLSSNLKEERDRLLKLLEKLNEEIENIKKSYPYILKSYLEDEDLKLQRIEGLNYQYASYKIAIETLMDNIEALLRRLDE